MNNLPEIKDIHIPDSVSIFPLPQGWWWILASVVLFFIFIWFFLFILKTSKKIYAKNQLNQIDIDKPIIAAIQISELMRRICTVKYKSASAIYGEDWIKFLEEHSKLKLSDDASKLLIYAPFMDKNSNSYSIQNAVELKEFCKHFIGENL